MRFVGDKDERGKALSANVERGAGIFYFNFHSSDIDRTVYIARWHAYHHHQHGFLSEKKYKYGDTNVLSILVFLN